MSYDKKCAARPAEQGERLEFCRAACHASGIVSPRGKTSRTGTNVRLRGVAAQGA